MNILAYLILAHLLGDFIFQPKKLVLWKKKSKKGGIVHALIHFILTTLVLLPFIINGYAWLMSIAFLLSFVHFWIDEAKINYSLKHDTKIKPVIVDQILHLLVILVAYFFISDINFVLPATPFYEAYTNIKVIILIFLLVFSGLLFEIYRFQTR